MLTGPSYVACLVSHHYALKSLRGGKKCVLENKEQNPGSGNIGKIPSFMSLLIFYFLLYVLVMVLINILELKFTSEKKQGLFFS